MKTIIEARVPIKIWAEESEVEAHAINQLKNIASLPFVFKHVAAMPDVHLGIGATVGSVIAMQKAIVPAAVGVDIGCGMMAVKTSLPKERVLDRLPAIRHSIERSVPVAHNGNTRITDTVAAWEKWGEWDNLSHKSDGLKTRATCQLGTLGGGNHFIEICLDKEESVWVMLHSGSRNLGKTLAERHINDAKGLMKKMFISLPDPDLAYFVEGTPEFKNYVSDVEFCQAYAFENRKEMMRRILKDLAYASNEKIPFEIGMEVNCHHNYLSRENHYGENVIITRKGAVRARKGDLGIIPGSMGARSFIVRGLGNPESFDSCSHGAGRKMSRTQARKQFTVDDLVRETEGVECRKDGGVLDELPSAYKDIEKVMANQADLVEIVAELKQVMCVKG